MVETDNLHNEMKILEEIITNFLNTSNDRRVLNSSDSKKSRTEAFKTLKKLFKIKPSYLCFGEDIVYIDQSISLAIHFAKAHDVRIDDVIHFVEKQLDDFITGEVIEDEIIFDKRKKLCIRLCSEGYFDEAIKIMDNYKVMCWKIPGLINIALVNVNEHKKKSMKTIEGALLELKGIKSETDYEIAISEIARVLVKLHVTV